MNVRYLFIHICIDHSIQYMHVIFSPLYEFMYRMFFLYSREEIKDKITCNFNSIFWGYLYCILRMSIGLQQGLSLRLMINLFQVSLLFKRLVVTDAHTCNRNDLPHAHVYEQFIYTVKGILTSPSWSWVLFSCQPISKQNWYMLFKE